MSQHKNSLKRSQSILHKAIRKYGWDSFVWEVVCECSSREELDQAEIEHINLYDCHQSNGKGYNMTKGGDYNPMSDPDIRNRAKISMGIAMKAFCGENNVMSNPDVRERHLEAMRHMATTPEWKKVKSEGDQRQKGDYEITFPDGHIEIIHGLSAFCKEHGLAQSKMSSVASGNRAHHKGFVCKLIQHNKPAGKRPPIYVYTVLTPFGLHVDVHNLRKFCEDNDLSYTCMLAVFKGRHQQHKGYRVLSRSQPPLCEV